MTKVSVIIPVYNVEKYLRQCLDSILGQTLKEIEVTVMSSAPHPRRAKGIWTRMLSRGMRSSGD